MAQEWQDHNQELEDMRSQNKNLMAQVQQHLQADRDRTHRVEQLVEERICPFLSYSNMQFDLANVPHLIHVTERGVAASAGPVLNIILGMANQQVVSMQRISDEVTRYGSNFDRVPRPRCLFKSPLTSQHEGYTPECAMQGVSSLSNAMGPFIQRAWNSYNSVMFPRMIRDSEGLVDKEFLNRYGANTTDGLHKGSGWR
ncbi:hypothetical protein PQX77_021579 [Marasmius sp. AFHP31]|nr:hypothetical protein PQX77_021579 [Marasmius sp. AFHP31]